MGNLTFLELAAKILKEERKPLTGDEIWETAKNKGYDRLVSTTGKTPGRSIAAQLYVDTRDNDESLFIRIGSRPTRFFLKDLGTEGELKRISVKKAEKLDKIKAVHYKEIIISKAIEILAAHPQGVRYRELINKISQALPEVKINTIHGHIWGWEKKSGQVVKPERGIYKLRPERGIDEEPKRVKRKETDEDVYYEPFAKFLMKLGECTKAIKVGGKTFRDKWGTPDVMGYREATRDKIYRPPLEIVSAEVKSDDKDLITAFGQACAYKIFSHRSYVVVPKPSEEDIVRLEALCMILGIGLVLHDAKPDNPTFEIRVRASKHEPDMEYVNKYLSLIQGQLGLR